MKKFGFTLIELLVTVSILGLMLGAGVTQYGRFNKRQQLQQGTENFVSYLKEVRKLAMTSSMPASGACANPDTLGFYEVGRTSPNTVALRIDCISDSQVWDGKEFALPGDAAFNSFSTIQFNAFDGQLMGGSPIDVDISHPDLTTTFTVTIERSGLVYENTP